MNEVVVIYGPTAVGKSAIAVELAKRINGEIISADSMQIYKHLNVGTAKVTEDEMQGVVHYLIDIKEPWENYSVFDFCNDANIIIQEILAKGKTPIIVGGTGLYIKGLTEGYNFAGAEKNEEFRQQISNLSNSELYKMIKEQDSRINVDKENRQRLIRVLERAKFGDSLSKKQSQFSFKMFAILDDREKIYSRINVRVDKMLQNGLIDEAKYVKSLGLPEDNLAIKAIGYKELFSYLDGKESLESCANILKQKSRNYAKRQFTFLNQFKNITKINFCGVKETAEIIVNNLENNI